MSASSFQRLRDQEEGEYIDSLPVLNQPRDQRSNVWLVFLHILAACTLLSAVALLIVTPLFLIIEWRPKTGAIIVASLSVVTSIAAGICAPMSVELGTRKDVKAWIITHWILFGVNAIFLLTFGIINPDIIVILITMGVFQFFYLVFLAIFTPQVSVPDLRRAPRCCGTLEQYY